MFGAEVRKHCLKIISFLYSQINHRCVNMMHEMIFNKDKTKSGHMINTLLHPGENDSEISMKFH